MNHHFFWMKRAIKIAKHALSKGKIPIGSVLVWNNFEIGLGLNFKQFNYYSLAHSEINSVKQASFYCANRIMKESVIYITLEPCSICLSSLEFFNIKYVVFGTYYNKHTISENHITKIKLIGGILEKECAALLSAFYIKNY